MKRNRTKVVVRRTERGWHGFHRLAYYCRFRRNTLLERVDNENRVVVATTGLLDRCLLYGEGPFVQDGENPYQHCWEPDERPLDEKFLSLIEGSEIYYQTRTFYAMTDGEFWLADYNRNLDVGNYDINRPEAIAAADVIHNRCVRKILKLMKSGEV